MKALKGLVALCLVLAAVPAWAAGHRYRLMAIVEDANQIGFLDLESIKRTPSGGTHVSLWVEPEDHMVDGHNISYALRTYRIDCDAHTSQMIHVSIFTDKDEMVFDRDLPDRKPDVVTETSTGREFFNAICGGPTSLKNPAEYGTVAEAVVGGRKTLRATLAGKKP